MITPPVQFPSVFKDGIDFALSASVLAIGVIACFFFFIEWLKHKHHKFLLYWSLGFLGIYWFQIPAILFHAGASFTLSDFNLFYSISFPLAFIGLVAIYKGIRSVGFLKPGWIKNYHLWIWMILSLAVFGTYVYLFGSAPDNYVIEFLVVFLFFLPVYFLNMYGLIQWKRDWKAVATKTINAGIVLMFVGLLIGLSENFLALRQILMYPPQFWFLAVASSRVMYLLQSVGMVFMITGFFFTHHGFKRMKSEDVKSIAGV
ncbi:MAG: hypothetical protein KGJ89_00180 [Patescibacteria group bacterium]|nr:hypothetical protein [Patescibacteria group bacterium]